VLGSDQERVFEVLLESRDAAADEFEVLLELLIASRRG